MLVLTRKTKQQIQIGPNITITILQIKGQAVRVGVEAPRDVCVLRTEMADKMAADDCDPDGDGGLGKSSARVGNIFDTLTTKIRVAGQWYSANGSLRCRAPRVDGAPVNSPYQSTGPASFLRPRRRRITMK